MNRYSFIETHSKRVRFIFCELCDAASIETHKYFTYTVMHNFPDGAPCPIKHNALDCCLHLGDIVDWEEVE